MLFVALCGKNGFKRRADDAVHVAHHIRLFCVGESKCGRMSELALHDFAHDSHTVFPRGEHEGEFSVFLGECEHFESNFGENAKASFAAHHDLVDVRTRCFSRCTVGDDSTDRGDVLLFENKVCRASVVGGVLTAAASDNPAAHARILKRLREVTAGVSLGCAEIFGSVVENLFKIRTADAGLNGDCGVDFVESDDFVEVLADVDHDVGRHHRLCAARDARSACVDVDLDAVCIGVFDKTFDLIGSARIDNDVGHVFDNAFSKAHDVDHGLPYARRTLSKSSVVAFSLPTIALIASICSFVSALSTCTSQISSPVSTIVLKSSSVKSNCCLINL